LKKPIFTEANLRTMAISWTTTLDAMKQIPGIDRDSVDRWGARLIPLVERYFSFYEEATSENDSLRKNPIVIDLSDDTDDVDEDNEAEELDLDEGSRYFSMNESSARSRPWDKRPSPPRNSSRSFPTRGRGRGGFRGSGRKSNGSTSGRNSSGISKRKFSGSSKKGFAAKTKANGTSKPSDLMKSFGRPGGRRGGGTGGGIGMAPI